MPRFFDVIFSIFGLLILSPILLILFIGGTIDTGAPIFFQKRLGKNKKEFTLFKFRSMKLETNSLGTHLIDANSITQWGKIIRKLKLDELPQLFNVLIGDMSLVGPRPNLPNQLELIKEREARNVYSVRPGITGLSQINKVDMSTPKLLAEMDSKMIQNFSTLNYFKYLFLTLSGKGFGDRARY